MRKIHADGLIAAYFDANEPPIYRALVRPICVPNNPIANPEPEFLFQLETYRMLNFLRRNGADTDMGEVYDEKKNNGKLCCIAGRDPDGREFG